MPLQCSQAGLQPALLYIRLQKCARDVQLDLQMVYNVTFAPRLAVASAALHEVP